jgi:hypothetical protein
MELDKIKRPNKPTENWIEACHLYMDTLKDVLTPIVYNTVYSIHEDAIRLTEKGGVVERTFMDYLAEVKVWSITIINGESQEILTHCPWFSSLLRGVFVSNVMVLSSAQLNRPNAPASKLRLNIPPVPVFVQSLYTQAAGRFFNQPHLFKTQGVTSDVMIEHKNQAQREIHQAIESTVRGLLPLPQIIESAMNFRGNNPIISSKQAPSSRRRDTSSVAFPTMPPPQGKLTQSRDSSSSVPSEKQGQQLETLRSSASEFQKPRPSSRPSGVVSATSLVSNAVASSEIVDKRRSSHKTATTLENPRVSTMKATSVRTSGVTPSKLLENSEFRQSSISFSKKPTRKSSPVKIRPSEFRERIKSEALDEVLDRLRFNSIESRESIHHDSLDSSLDSDLLSDTSSEE